jgi:hypothetical protein
MAQSTEPPLFKDSLMLNPYFLKYVERWTESLQRDNGLERYLSHDGKPISEIEFKEQVRTKPDLPAMSNLIGEWNK